MDTGEFGEREERGRRREGGGERVRKVVTHLIIPCRCKEIVDTIRNDAHTPILCMRCDGGVTRNDFVVQFCADMIDIQIERSAHVDMTAVGACFMAGLGSGMLYTK